MRLTLTALVLVYLLAPTAHAQGPTTISLDSATLGDVNAAFDAGSLTSEQLVEMCLARIRAYDCQGPSSVNHRQRLPSMRASPFMSRPAVLILTATVLFAEPASSEQVRVMTAGGMAAAHLALVPHFERTTGHNVVTDATSTGIGRDSIASRVRRGEPVDVLILARAALDELIAEGKVVGASRVDLARSSIGIAVRRGAPKPDISSVDALKRTLLQAKSIAYSAQVSGTYLSTELFPRLGIADEVLRKSKRVEVGRVGTVIARGEAEVGFQQISELLEVPGIDYLGPLPAEVQRVTIFSAGVAVSAKSPDAARALIEFFASRSGMEAMTKSGLDPISRQ
jgi:molybdate transport system substrate-binding protein